MKTRIPSILAIIGIHAAAILPSCTTDGKIDHAKAATVVDLALNYAVKTGKVTPGDAALVREVGTIVLDQSAAPVVTISGK